MHHVTYIFLLTVAIASHLLAQGRPYEGPEDPAGDISAVRIGFLNGNRVLMPFENTSTLGRGLQSLYSRWPNSYEGTQMTDNITVMIGSEVYVTQDSIPVTTMAEVRQLAAIGELDTIYFLQGNDPGRNDYNYDHTIDWAMYPVPGYFNETQDYLAQSNKPDSWPPAGWPSTGFEKKWQGEWNGRFGRGVTYADLETYFVANDAQDLENIVQRNDPYQNLITEGPRYYPRPGVKIGDINPAVTVQKGYPWGGLGLRVALRCFQWNNPEAKDMIFMEYEVSNISEYDLLTSGFGFFLDTAVGGEHSPDGDVGYFDKKLDLAYAWDFDGVGVGGFQPGVLGMAFLESPGRAYDNIDTDEDGLIDEKRDNPAGEFIGPYDGIANLANFLDFYNMKEEELRDHYEGDEDQDWQDGIDLNGNGVYATQDVFGEWKMEPGEYAGDDVGLDGVAPGDLNYFGPDEGECNHRPDFREGVGCEPNFAATDVSESDMIGLTSFSVFDWYEWTGYSWQLQHDENTWKLMRSMNYREIQEEPNSIYFLFGSTTFPFFKGRTERISMSMLFAYENLSGLQSSEHSAPNLKRLKDIAQIIYERDYRFAQPPLMPTLRATAGDGKVILTWDDVADKLTREPFLDRVNDFEGYKVYRATDKLMTDPEIITDGQGAKMFRQPLYQCDLVDNIQGYADYGLVGGRAYYLGDETGITHYFVDENVQNGRTYYYAVVAYDYGIKELAGGMSPTENNVVIELDESEKVVRMGKNVAVVTPHAMAAGYLEPEAETLEAETVGSGRISVSVVDRNAVKPGHTYKIKFDVDTVGYARKNPILRHPTDLVRVNNGLRIYDVTENNRLVYEENPAAFPLENIMTDGETKVLDNYRTEVFSYYRNDKDIYTDVFDGIQLKLSNMAVLGDIDEEASGWTVGGSPITVIQSSYESHAFPNVYDIIFTDNDSAHTGKVDRPSYIFNLIGGTGMVVGASYVEFKYMMNRKLPFYVLDRSLADSSGNYESCEILVEDLNRNNRVDFLEDQFLVGHYYTIAGYTWWSGTVFGFHFHDAGVEENLPEAGSVYRVSFNRPFTATDSVLFTTTSAVEVQEADLNATMEEIRIVPNPYVATNLMEPAVGNKYLNQRRRLMFTHIPADCVIRIYTPSGVLVDRIDVDNETSNGIVHWDLLSREDLEIAAGMYVYHVKSNVTGKEKIGKFAIIK